jgi:hypothetical protein
MTRKLKPVTQADEITIQRAIIELRMIRDNLKKANALQAVGAVRRAIKSTEGALRHTSRCLDVQDRRAAKVAAEMKDITGSLVRIFQASDFGGVATREYVGPGSFVGLDVDLSK